jgi:hypothetical protein
MITLSLLAPLAALALSTSAPAMGSAPIGDALATQASGPSLLAVQRGGEEEDVVEDKRDVIKELIKEFEGHTKKKGKEDAEAVKVMDKLLAEFAESGPKDRASIVKALEKSLTLKRKDHKDGAKEARVAMAAAVCLGEMAPESVKPLISITSGKKLRGNNDLRRRAIISLGKTEDERAVKPLLSLMSDKMPIIQGAAIEALGQFRDQDQKVRKSIVEDLLKLIMPIKSTVDTDTNDTITREQYDVIGPPTITTMQRLTDQNMRDFVEWQQWWNKNKRKDWDADED